MKELKIKISEVCEDFISLLENKMGCPSPDAGLKAPSTPLKEMGKGTYFVGYREYTPIDDARFIDWKASIRSNKLLVKKFEKLKILDIIFLFDVSSSMMFSSTEKLKCEYAAELIASLSYSALELGCNVGLVMFSNKIVGEVPPDSKPEHLSLILNTLSNIELYGGGYSLTSALRYVQENVKDESLIIIISDFIGLERGWEHYLKMIGEKFYMVGMMIRDPIDYSFTKSGGFCFGDPFSERRVFVESKKVKEGYEISAKKIIMDIETKFRLANAFFFAIKTDEEFENYLIKLGVWIQ